MADDEQTSPDEERLMQRFVALCDRYPAARHGLEQAFLLGVTYATERAGKEPMPGSVAVQCSNCGTSIIVMPAQVYRAVSDVFGGAEAELRFNQMVKADQARTGERLAVADVEGGYTCPECGHHDQLPGV